MNNKKKLLRTLGIIFFTIGIVAGMVMFVFMNWANFEAFFYFGYNIRADKALSTIRCPLLMTSSETAALTIRLTNNTELDLAIPILTEISNSDVARSEKTDYPIAKGETRKLSWRVTSGDIVFGNLILAHVYVNQKFTLPSRANTCGTVVVNLPGLTGLQLFFILLAFITGCLVAGWWFWLSGSRSLQTEGLIATRAMSVFTIIVVIGLLAGCIGWWLVGLICCVASLLMILVVSVYYFQKHDFA
jgi:hypothetical protein